MVRKYGGESRWVYLDELLEYTILKNRCDELLRYLFDIDKFRDFFT